MLLFTIKGDEKARIFTLFFVLANKKPCKALFLQGLSLFIYGLFVLFFPITGRRDWIRTNDPHHVKVVL